MVFIDVSPPGLRNGIMLLKSLAVSVAAALLGPTLGIAMFFLANSDSASGQQLASAQAIEVQAAAAELPGGLGSWQTVVRCPDGQALSKDGRCRSSDTQPPT